jgi:hypothetical protein
VGFVVAEVAMGKLFTEYFDFPANLHSTNCSTITIIYHLELVHYANSGRSPLGTAPH